MPTDAKQWQSAWRHDGRKFATIHDVVRTMKHKGRHLGVSAHRASLPTISDGYEVCVHEMDRGSRCPMRPILSCASRDEARSVARLLRRCCAAWMAEGLTGLDHYDEIDRRIGAIARRLGYREDHHNVWHRSPAWLDTPSHSPGVLWRDTTIGQKAAVVWEASDAD